MLSNGVTKRSVVLLLMIVLAACAPTSPTITNVMPNLRQSSPIPPTLTSVLLTSEPLFVPPQPTPQSVVGGGMVENGPFLFDLRLFNDTSFSQQPIASSLYSDMNGAGSFMYWCYQGSEPIGPIETYWGTLPQLNQLLQETYESIQPGSCGGRTGGILLPGGLFIDGESKVGDWVQVALKVRTGDKEFGAVISFTLTQGPNGFEPINISVTPLQENGG